MEITDLRRAFTMLDMQGLGLERDDVMLLLAFTEPTRWTKFFHSIRSYTYLRERFADEPWNEKRFLAFARCLFDLIYGKGATADRFMDAVVDFMKRTPKLNVTGATTREPVGRNVIYGLYADKFAGDFDKLILRLPYLREKLHVTIIWILPFLDSPKDDGGYDQRDRKRVDTALGGNSAFERFCEAAKEKGMTVMMDLVLNHRSWETMRRPGKPDASYTLPDEYFIWCDGDEDKPPVRFAEVSCFEGLRAPDSGSDVLAGAGREVRGPWTYNKERRKWFYNSFLPQQPDVNYNNPDVLIDDLNVIVEWMDKGVVTLLRADAVPFLFKRDRSDIVPEVEAALPEVEFTLKSYAGTELPHVHLMIRFLGAFLAFRYGGTASILTESNSPLERWRKYFGEGIGAKLNYQFYRMQALWASAMRCDRAPLARALSASVVSVPHAAGVMFLRVHDELTFEHAESNVAQRGLKQLNTKMREIQPDTEDPDQFRAFEEIRGRFSPDHNIYDFCKRGIAARFSSILRALPKNPDLSEDEDLLQKHGMMMSVMMSLEDIPLIFMGDEWGEPDSWTELLKTSPEAGSGLDMRNLHRSIRDLDIYQKLWDQKAPDLHQRLFDQTQRIISARLSTPPICSGSLKLLYDIGGDESTVTFLRSLGNDHVLVACNFGLCSKNVTVSMEGDPPIQWISDLLGVKEEDVVDVARLPRCVRVRLAPRQTRWIRLSGYLD